MKLIEWRDDFRTGHTEVDHEHRTLIELINEAYAAAGAEPSSTQLEECLGEIHARVAAHFALEEKVMTVQGYDELASHKQDHEKLLDDIRDIMDAAAESGVIDERAFGARLADWFGTHFRTHDARLHGRLG